MAGPMPGQQPKGVTFKKEANPEPTPKGLKRGLSSMNDQAPWRLRQPYVPPSMVAPKLVISIPAKKK